MKEFNQQYRCKLLFGFAIYASDYVNLNLISEYADIIEYTTYVVGVNPSIVESTRSYDMCVAINGEHDKTYFSQYKSINIDITDIVEFSETVIDNLINDKVTNNTASTFLNGNNTTTSTSTLDLSANVEINTKSGSDYISITYTIILGMVMVSFIYE
jgi:hypothetical protein